MKLISNTGVARLALALIIPCIHAMSSSGQEIQVPSAQGDSNASTTSIVRLMVEPMVYNTEEWKIGDRLTVKVNCESDKETRVIGIATDVELISIENFDNRWEMMLRSSSANIDKIKTAIELSEYWFTVTKFVEKHRQLVAGEPEVRDFLKKNKGFRAADGTNWGWNANSKERLRIPTAGELPSRAK